MGVTDLAFAEPQGSLLTSSSDRTVKKWKLDLAGKSLEEEKSFQVSEADEAQLKDNVDKQLLGVVYEPNQKQAISVSCNSDLNVWNLEGEDNRPS